MIRVTRARRDAAFEIARRLGCTHWGESRIVTRPDAFGYTGGELWTLSTSFGLISKDGFFIEKFQLGFSRNSDADEKRSVSWFTNLPDGGRRWSRVIAEATFGEQLEGLQRC